MPEPSDLDRIGKREAFPATRWSLVAQVRSGGAPARAALEELCTLYWRPVFVYIRRRGHTSSDAEDYTQQFFAELLADDTFHSAHVEDGRLRTFLLSALQRSLADGARWRCRKKRGGGLPAVSLESARAEDSSFAEPLDYRSPEQLYLLAWARGLLDQTRQRLRESYGSRAEIYKGLESFLDRSDAESSYREAAARLGIPAVTARVYVSRLRKRFAEMLKDQVRQTVESVEETEEELAWLKTVFAQGEG